MEERRLLLAVALSLLVLTAYQLMFPPPPPTGVSDPGAAPAVEATDATPPAVASTPSAPGESATLPDAEGTEEAAAAAAVVDDAERRIEVRTERLEVALTNRGGELLSWRLLYSHDAAGDPEEMVQTYSGLPLPLSIETGDAALDARLSEALFVPSATQLSLSGDETERLVLRYAEGDLEVEKSLEFSGQGYLVNVGLELYEGGSLRPARLIWGPGIANPSEAERGVSGYQPPHAVWLDAEAAVERVAADDLDAGREISRVRWAGVESQYFAALWIPEDGVGRAFARGIALPPDPAEEQTEGPLAGLEFAGGGASLFVGPKDYFLLDALGAELTRVVPVGDWIGPIVVPLMRLLRWVNQHIGNYGWSIVALTVLINLVMAPLRHFSIANGIKMARLAPEMRVIQERYRKVPALDPRRQEMQKEVAALYARHGMSMSTQLTVGCLPLLLTMPFLIGIYRVLQIFIELRGAGFLWIPDLSQPDPLFLTPLLMGGSMFLMQRMTPSSMDPAQQRMMMIMPVVLLGMFLWAPAGLNLYWLTANVCSIGQQAITMSVLRARGESLPKRAPAAGGGKKSGKGRKR